MEIGNAAVSALTRGLGRDEAVAEVAITVASLIPNLDAAEAARRFHQYETAHARTAARLLDSMGRSYDGSDEDRVRMMENIPMVSFRRHESTRRADGPSD